MADKVYEIRVVLDGQESINTDGTNVSSGDNLNSRDSRSGLTTAIGVSTLTEQRVKDQLKDVRSEYDIVRQDYKNLKSFNTSSMKAARAFDVNQDRIGMTVGKAKQNALDTFGFGVDAPTTEDYNTKLPPVSEGLTQAHKESDMLFKEKVNMSKLEVDNTTRELKRIKSMEKYEATKGMVTSNLRKFSGVAGVAALTQAASFTYNELTNNNISNLSMGGNNLASRNAQLYQSRVNNIGGRVASAATSVALGFTVGGPIGAGVMLGIQAAGFGIEAATTYPKYQRAMREYEPTTASSNYMKDIIANRLVSQTIYRR